MPTARKIPTAAFALVLAIALIFGSAAAASAQTAKGPGKSDPKAVKIIQTLEAKQDLTGLDVTNLFTIVQKKDGEADRVL